MNVLIFLAHGSRRPESNDEVRAIADAIRPDLKARFDRVDAAYLEIAAPSLADAIDSALGQGARYIAVYPYFLNSGSHVERDIPGVVERFQRRNPDCSFQIMPHFGRSDEIKTMISEQILSS